MTRYDAMVIGGGLFGSAIAYGLARAGLRVALVDEGDVAYRASRGHFGLGLGAEQGRPRTALPAPDPAPRRSMAGARRRAVRAHGDLGRARAPGRHPLLPR